MRALFNVASLCTFFLVTTAARGQTKRPMTVDDVLALQTIDWIAPSPDGRWLAAVIKRSGGPPDANDDDVWLVPRHGGTAKNLTASMGKSARWRTPVWSPDGARLFMIAMIAERSLRPYIWTMRTGALKPLIDRDVDTHAWFGASWPTTPVAWLDSVTVLAAVWPRDARAASLWRWGTTVTIERAAEEGWAKTDSGVEPGVSVIESGRDVPELERPQGQLVRIDVRTGTYRTLLDGWFWKIILSPTKRFAALIVDAGRVSPSPDRRMLYLHHLYAAWRHTRLAIVRLDSIAPVQWVDAVHDLSMLGSDENDAVPHAWSPDGNTLAVVAKEDSSERYGATAYLVSALDGSVRQLTDRNLDVSATTWAGNSTVLVLAQRTAFAAPGIDTTRYDWWKINADAGDRNGMNITSDLANVPLQLLMTPDTNELLGIGGGRLMSINPGLATGQRVHLSSDSSELAWAWPSRSMIGTPHDALFVQNARGDVYAIHLSEPGSMTLPQLIPRPTAEATLEAVDPAHHLTVFSDVGPTGTALWVGDGETKQFEKRLDLNQFVRDIADPKRVLIHYVGADGDSLEGLITLPIGYTAGHRYPLVAEVYGGVMVRDTTLPIELTKQFSSWFNENLLLAHGYAVLTPSVPVSPEGEAGDPMTDIPKGIIAAVDEGVRVGIADPERLGVMGVSFGGYSTYSVVTYTKRFRAAIAISGYADIASMYGDFTPAARYLDFAYEMQHEWGLDENGQSRMGTHPWNNLWRYIRNSPYFIADRVQTPIMIIQGDMDFVGMSQGEEFFSAMYRLGKPAKFVRYWGEGHGIDRSPANVRDVWSRMLAWLDEHLGAGQRSANAGGH